MAGAPFFRMQEYKRYHLSLHKPEGPRRVSRSATKWLELKTMGIRNCMRKSQNSSQNSCEYGNGILGSIKR
jgi:hypothetical protein